jgi:hypothetical protein
MSAKNENAIIGDLIAIGKANALSHNPFVGA